MSALTLVLACHSELPFTAEERARLLQLSPSVLPAPRHDASNRFAGDARAAALGQKLFFDAGFSGPLLDGDNDGGATALGVRGEAGKVSCAGCHVPSAGFLDDRSRGKQISLAAGWNLRRTPSLLDVGQARLLMWDGRRDSLHSQPFGPIENPNEMNASRLYAAERIFSRYRAEYEPIFGPLPPLDDASRFPPLEAHSAGCDRPIRGAPGCHGKPGDGAEYDSMSAADQDAVTRVVINLGKAIAAYERLLSCGQGRFDAFLHGDPSAMTASEQRGAKLFVGKAQCVRCHSGPFLSDQQFHNVGLLPRTVAAVFTDANDRGAGPGLAAALADPLNVRGKYSDGDDGRLPDAVAAGAEGAFRTPILRCVARRPSFLHTAQLRTLAEVVAFFDRGGDRAGYPGTSEIAALGLAADEQQDLVAFLLTLEGPGPAPALLR
ncbi:MAG: cytochrome-c peroxidase [Myxococcales bacterium]